MSATAHLGPVVSGLWPDPRAANCRWLELGACRPEKRACANIGSVATVVDIESRSGACMRFLLPVGTLSLVYSPFVDRTHGVQPERRKG